MNTRLSVEERTERGDWEMSKRVVDVLSARHLTLPALSAGIVICVAALMLPSFLGIAANGLQLAAVDIGDGDDELAYIDESTWGPIWEDTGDSWGELGEGNCRVVWAPGGDDRDAYITFPMPDGFRGSIQYMVMTVLDGMADDSFTVEAYDPATLLWVPIYQYTAVMYDDSDGDGLDNVETWIDHVVYFVDITTWVCMTHGCCWYYAEGLQVRITATGDPWLYFGTYGQLGVDSILLFGNGQSG